MSYERFCSVEPAPPARPGHARLEKKKAQKHQSRDQALPCRPPAVNFPRFGEAPAPTLFSASLSLRWRKIFAELRCSRGTSARTSCSTTERPARMRKGLTNPPTSGRRLHALWPLLLRSLARSCYPILSQSTPLTAACSVCIVCVVTVRITEKWCGTYCPLFCNCYFHYRFPVQNLKYVG